MKNIFLIILISMQLVALTGCSQEITFSGKPGTTKTISEEKKRMELYISVMKNTFQKENGGKEFIAVKLDTLEGLSDAAKKEVLKELTTLSPNVFSFQEVKNDKEKFKYDDQGRLLMAINGTVLSVQLEKYSYNKAIITGVSWFGNLGAVFPKYEAHFKNGKWNLKLVGMAIS